MRPSNAVCAVIVATCLAGVLTTREARAQSSTDGPSAASVGTVAIVSGALLGPAMACAGVAVVATSPGPSRETTLAVVSVWQTASQAMAIGMIVYGAVTLANARRAGRAAASPVAMVAPFVEPRGAGVSVSVRF